MKSINNYLNRRNNDYDRSDGPLYRQRQPRSRRKVVTIPERVGPHVHLFFSEMARQRRTYDQIEIASGIRRPTLKQWRKKNAPGLASVEAALNALGFELHAVPASEVLPPEIAADLAACGAKMRAAMPETFAAMVNIAARQMIEREGAAAIIAEHDRERAAYRLAKCAASRRADNDNTRRTLTGS